MSYKQLWIIKVILLVCLGLSLAGLGRTSYRVVTSFESEDLNLKASKIKANSEEIHPVEVKYQTGVELSELPTEEENNFFTPLQPESSGDSDSQSENLAETLTAKSESKSDPEPEPDPKPESHPASEPDPDSNSEFEMENISLAVAAISVYGSGEKNMAILKDKTTNDIYLVKEGTKVNDYQVVAIKKTSVILEQEEQKLDLTLPDGDDE